MARLMGPAKTLFWWLPASPGKNSWPKDLFLTMVNATKLEPNSCVILGMGLKMLQSEELLEPQIHGVQPSYMLHRLSTLVACFSR